MAFVEQASQDQFGLKVKLPGGNVASRVLPIQIHDLDKEDKKLLEGELGGYLRGIEFIYKEPGVNKPLTIGDDEKKNLSNTKYLIQINKVANAIKEIITAIGQYHPEQEEPSGQVFRPLPVSRKKNKLPVIAGSVILLALIMLGVFLVPRLFKSSEPLNKSIAVLAFENNSNDPEQESLSDGIVITIINNLGKVGGFDVSAATASMRYKKSTLSLKTIARELGVSTLLEGSVR